ncbi:permease for cytosine/purines, uracil, thiamine, allantoin-domain-containing protein [Mycena capillaripes]|nr:permease for cytosine/purines, uracil, thiamine, allantoin-domain-containing protein [Mycena capillaripes]
MFSSWWTLSTWRLERPDPRRWSNQDMEPVPVHLRTWTSWNYVAYWISDAMNPVMWELASSMIAVGLSWKQALSAISVGHIIIAAVIVLNGTMGARLHIAFPASHSASFGFWFSYICVLSRVILSIFWFGIGTFQGSECIYQMLKAIWPSIARIPNNLPQSAGITTAEMACFFIFWLVQLPLLLISPRHIRHLFVAKALLVPATFIAMLAWAMARAPPHLSLAKPGALNGSASAWAFLGAMNSAIGAWSTLSVNISDFTRYAINEKAQYVQAVFIPAIVTLVGFCGIAVASASEVLYGSVIWDPMKIIDHWESRAASFFAAFSFTLAVLGTNIAANSLSAANDMTVLMPRYINIRRGQVICAVLGGWTICPWKIVSSAPRFLNFMSGYSIFLGPFAAIMVVDYWIIHKCKIKVDDLYNPQGRYRYWNGINWRAAVAFFLGFAPNVPGLAASLNPALRVNGMQTLFNIAWIYGFSSTALVYWVLSMLFPADGTFVGDDKEALNP